MPPGGLSKVRRLRTCHRRARARAAFSKDLKNEELRIRVEELEDIVRLAYPVLREADQWSLVDRIDKIRS